MTKKTVVALQMGSDYTGKAATLRNILAFEKRIADSGACLVVMPEALLGGYPKGEQFGTRLGYRMPEGREAFARYYDNSIDLDGPELDQLGAMSTRTGATLVLGVIERGGRHCSVRPSSSSLSAVSSLSIASSCPPVPNG